MAKVKINIDDTRFIWRTNFSGDTERDNYGNPARKVSVVIPTEEQADRLRDMGVNVRCTKPRPGYEDEFEPTYYCDVKINMESNYPPHIYLITPSGRRVSMSKDTIGELDFIRIKNVCVQANLYEQRKNPGKFSLYADVMYVEQDVDGDPYYSRYCNQDEGSLDD